jgi:hypothetical protein
MTAEQFLNEKGVPFSASIYVTLPTTNRIPLAELLDEYHHVNTAQPEKPVIKTARSRTRAKAK